MRRPLFLAFLFLATPAAHSALVLQIDSTAETLTFLGSDTGNFTADFGVSELDWFLAGAGGGVPEILDVSASFTISTVAAGTNSFNVSDDGTTQFSFFYFSEIFDPVTVTGTGALSDYSRLSSAAKTTLSTLSGDMLLFKGTGFSPISVQQIPEPASLALLPIAILLCARRKRS